MFRTSTLVTRGLLLAGAVALPLSGAQAQTNTTQTPTAPAAAAAAIPAATPGTQADSGKTDATKMSTDKKLGALKATPAEKKAAHDKAVVATKTAAKQPAHVVKAVPNGAATTATPAAKSSATAPVSQ